MLENNTPTADIEMINNALSKAASKYEEIFWLVNDHKEVARSTREFLNNCFANIPAAKYPRIIQKLAGDANEIKATIHELVVHELLHRLGLTPELEPSVGKLKPDLSFKVKGKRFFADVLISHSPSKTIKDFGDGTGCARDTSKKGESRTHKITEKLEAKALKYKCLAEPLIVFVFLGDHQILGPEHVEKALFGMTISEVGLEARFPISVDRDCVPVGGMLLPDEDSICRHSNLSAVVSCDWFNTLNPEARGRRLHCFILHNWAAQHTLPVETFKHFPQIIWKQIDSNIWQPELTLEACTVAKFTLDGELEYREYRADKPW